MTGGPLVRGDLVALLPLLLPAAGSVVLLLALAVRRSALVAFSITAAALLAGLVAVPTAAGLTPRTVTDLVVVDRLGLLFVALFLASSLAVLLLWRSYVEQSAFGRPEEFYVILLLALVGAGTLALSRHFVSFFLGLETLSVGLYGMIAYLRQPERGLEAAVKYLLLAGASSAFFLFGLALVYLGTGSMAFPDPSSVRAAGPLMVSGGALLVVAVGFKLGVAPFHMWTPDVYEGAPAPVTAFIATVSKGAVVAVVLRLFSVMGGWLPALWLSVAALAGASMIVGNVLALLQDDVKRLLAYSSIAHLGYLLVALLVGGEPGAVAAVFYLIAYVVTILTAFATVSVLSSPDREAGPLAAYRGLWWQRPGVAAPLTLSLLSLAGLPVTGGFVAKFYLVGAGVSSALWTLVGILVITSVIGLFYYLRVVATLFAPAEGVAGGTAIARARPWLGGTAVLVGLGVALLWIGLWPEPLLEAIRVGVGELGIGS